MKEKLRNFGKLSLAKELSKNELKRIVGGSGGGGGTGGGGNPTGNHTVCTGGTYGPFACSPAYCQAAGHGTWVTCY